MLFLGINRRANRRRGRLSGTVVYHSRNVGYAAVTQNKIMWVRQSGENSKAEVFKNDIGTTKTTVR